MFGAPKSLRRRRRIKRGLCPACAYPVGQSPVCTECGFPLLRASEGEGLGVRVSATRSDDLNPNPCILLIASLCWRSRPVRWAMHGPANGRARVRPDPRAVQPVESLNPLGHRRAIPNSRLSRPRVELVFARKGTRPWLLMPSPSVLMSPNIRSMFTFNPMTIHINLRIRPMASCN